MKQKLIAFLLTTVFLLLCTSCSTEKVSQDDRYPYEYLGMTFGELKELWGDDYSIHDKIEYVAPQTIWYEDGRTPFLFSFKDVSAIENLTDDDVISEIFVKSGDAMIYEEIYGEEPTVVLDRLHTVSDSGIFTDDENDGYWVEMRIKKHLFSVRYYYFAVDDWGKLNYKSAPPYYVSVYAIPKEEQDSGRWHDELIKEYTNHPITGEMVWMIENPDTGYNDPWIEDPETGELIPYEVTEEQIQEYMENLLKEESADTSTE